MRIPRKTSISGMISLGSFFPFLVFDSISISISLETGFPNVIFSLSSATSKDFAIGLVDGYVSAMTCARISGVSRLRMDEIDRRARRENRASKSATARSSNGKLLLISVTEDKALVQVDARAASPFTYLLLSGLPGRLWVHLYPLHSPPRSHP